jgi:hypothetical protein
MLRPAVFCVTFISLMLIAKENVRAKERIVWGYISKERRLWQLLGRIGSRTRSPRRDLDAETASPSTAFRTML